ncbi:MAG: hypothetical protein K2O89_00755 [Clostridia bacterium]|nr:hypothetical protein [Clostridia bacterium]
MAKDCSKCAYFTRYYSKTYCGFYKEKVGRCWKLDKFCDRHDSCENYNTKYKQKIRLSVVIEALSKAVTDIDTIKNILEERDNK